MTDLTVPGPAAAAPRTIRFLKLPAPAMAALLEDDLDRANAVTGATLPAYFVSDRAKWLWRYRLTQLEEDPASAAWIVRAVATEPDGRVVGDAGFHGPPDAAGMVEIGYCVVPEHRRQGYATAIVAALLRRAGADPAVRTVRASISPDNAASLATVAKFGFTHVGEQWDDEDGLELIFETAPPRPATPPVPGGGESDDELRWRTAGVTQDPPAGRGPTVPSLPAYGAQTGRSGAAP